MPMLNVRTNVTVSDQGAVLKALSAEVAKILGKPESYVMVALEAEVPMVFAGSDAPLAYLELKSLGLPDERTAEFSAALCAAVGERLGVESGRIYIEFASPPRHFWGWDRRTF
ncbi:phenylpyruvate tautomerase MIF-related protein [Endothiovibrio diazotrophicus]